ncbi:MAG: hypothetical protein KC912_16380 [Proteobacteria bacterium]|nr:hypothetical protein [Pseudomonadota bacterium]
MKPWMLTFAFLVACNGNKTPPDAAGEEGTTEASTTEATEGPDVTKPGPVPGTEHVEPPVEGQPPIDKPDLSFGDSYWLLDEPAPTVENNVFKAVARHGGGCAEHEFSYRVINKGRSQPPTAIGLLHHNGNGDRCRALLVTPVEIDLNEALKDQGCIGKVSIAVPPVDGADEPSKALLFAIDPVGCE